MVWGLTKHLKGGQLSMPLTRDPLGFWLTLTEANLLTESNSLTLCPKEESPEGNMFP